MPILRQIMILSSFFATFYLSADVQYAIILLLEASGSISSAQDNYGWHRLAQAVCGAQETRIRRMEIQLPSGKSNQGFRRYAPS